MNKNLLEYGLFAGAMFSFGFAAFLASWNVSFAIGLCGFGFFNFFLLLLLRFGLDLDGFLDLVFFSFTVCYFIGSVFAGFLNKPSISLGLCAIGLMGFVLSFLDKFDEYVNYHKIQENSTLNVKTEV